MLLNILQYPGKAPTTRSYPAQNVDFAEVERTYFENHILYDN